MIALELISEEIPSLTVEQTGKDAFNMLGEYYVKHLPVLDDDKLVGIICEEDIFNHSLYDPIGTYHLELLRTYSVRPSDHIFTIIRVMGENRLTVVPVVDEDGKYVGLVSQNDLLAYFSQTNSFAVPGAIIVLAMQKSDYSLATLVRIAEQEDLHVISAVITSPPSEQVLAVTLKFSSQNISAVAASYERHGYTIREAYSETEYHDNTKERYDALMRFLEV